MTTHDVLAYSVATEAVRRIRAAAEPWRSIFSASAYVTASRSWPIPDFVIADVDNDLTVGVEFKPPRQTKREYLTGVGQAFAYTRDFDYALVVLPTMADDGYPIAEHVIEILRQETLAGCPVGLLEYDPSDLSARTANFDESHFFSERLDGPARPASLDNSFYAKWREVSPEEVLRYVAHCYDEMRTPTLGPGRLRDRAFNVLWDEIQAGQLHHWGGGVRHYDPKQKVAVSKNYRNFVRHIGWAEQSGSLTADGLAALNAGVLYGPNSRPFLDVISRAVLLAGKHLILFNAVSEFQDSHLAITDEQEWLAELEAFMDEKGLLKHNPERAEAAVAGSARGFLKAEKQLWRKLELIVPRGARVFHPNRGFIFNWSRITDLLQQ